MAYLSGGTGEGEGTTVAAGGTSSASAVSSTVVGEVVDAESTATTSEPRAKERARATPKTLAAKLAWSRDVAKGSPPQFVFTAHKPTSVIPRALDVKLRATSDGASTHSARLTARAKIWGGDAHAQIVGKTKFRPSTHGIDLELGRALARDSGDGGKVKFRTTLQVSLPLSNKCSVRVARDDGKSASYSLKLSPRDVVVETRLHRGRVLDLRFGVKIDPIARAASLGCSSGRSAGADDDAFVAFAVCA